MAKNSTLIVHSHELGWTAIREALNRIPVQIIGEATSKVDAIRLATDHQPEMIVASAKLAGECSVSVLADLRNAHAPSSKLVVFTHSDISFGDLMELGHLQLSGFLTWRETASTEYAYCALKLALSGNFVIGSSSLAAAYLSTLRGQVVPGRVELELTDLERRILCRRAEGVTCCEIAQCEGVSTRTVIRKLGVLREKFDVPDTATLLMKAGILGLVP